MGGDVGGDHWCPPAERFDNRQVEPLGERRAERGGRVAVAVVEFVIGDRFEPEQPAVQLGMLPDPAGDLFAPPAKLPDDDQRGTVGVRPQPLERIEGQRMILAGRHHPHGEIDGPRGGLLEGGLEFGPGGDLSAHLVEADAQAKRGAANSLRPGGQVRLHLAPGRLRDADVRAADRGDIPPPAGEIADDSPVDRLGMAEGNEIADALADLGTSPPGAVQIGPVMRPDVDIEQHHQVARLELDPRGETAADGGQHRLGCGVKHIPGAAGHFHEADAVDLAAEFLLPGNACRGVGIAGAKPVGHHLRGEGLKPGRGAEHQGLAADLELLGQLRRGMQQARDHPLDASVHMRLKRAGAVEVDCAQRRSPQQIPSPAVSPGSGRSGRRRSQLSNHSLPLSSPRVKPGPQGAGL